MGVFLVPGNIFARDFRVVRPLSEGGMGAVYIVDQLSTGSQRALKLMHPQLVNDPRLRQRFEQEARVGARIPSEHVVQVISAGVDQETSYPYLVMELLHGEDLAAALARGAFTPKDTWAVLAQICHALAAAHAAGIVHRDLKPENIFLAKSQREGGGSVAKILDFGIAKVHAEAQTHQTAAMGTPMWMSPEQTSPSAQLGPQADVWALGLIAFRMLTGRLYWRTANEDGSTASLMRELLIEEIVPANVRAAELGVAGMLPPGFDAWFSRCVARDIAPRFPDAAAARAALEPVLANAQPGQASPVSSSRTLAAAPLNATPSAFGGTAPSNPFVGRGPVAQPVPTPRRSGGAVVVALVGGLLGLGVLGGVAFLATYKRSSSDACRADVTEAEAAAAHDACKAACEKTPAACATQVELARRFKLGDDTQRRAASRKGCDAGDAASCKEEAALLEATDAAKAAVLYGKACEAGDVGACTLEAALLEEGRGGTRDTKRAAILYDKACQAGDVLGCTYQALAMYEGRGMPQDRAKAIAALKAAAPNLGAACEKGDGRACVALGAVLSAGAAGEADPKQGAALAQKGCDAGELAGCTNLGVVTLVGLGVAADPAKGLATLEKACDDGSAAACTDVGILKSRASFVLRGGVRGVAVFKLACGGVYGVGCSGWGKTYDTPKDVPLDEKGAVAASLKACDGGDLVGCVNLGAYEQYGVGAKRNRAKASERFKKACDAGDAGGCGELGTMYATGRGVAFDGKKAMDLFERACASGEADACVVVGDMMTSGIGVPKDVDKGTAVFKQHCEQGGLALACTAYANQLLGKPSPKDGESAKELLTKACDAAFDRRYPSACVTLGLVHELGLAGEKKDPKVAATFYRRACDDEGVSGCAPLARLMAAGAGVPKDAPKAIEMLESGCKRSDSAACQQLGLFHATGKAGLKEDGKAALPYLQEACDDANWEACKNIGLVHLWGIGKLPKNPAEAAKYLKLACEHGDNEACAKVKENKL